MSLSLSLMAGGGDGVVGQGWGCHPLRRVGAGHRCHCQWLRVVRAGAGVVCIVVVIIGSWRWWAWRRHH